MSLDDQLLRKAYYEMFINEHESNHPIGVLGELFQVEQKKDIPDLSYIRFAQGEVYFNHKDFEAAIFKWENIANELEPWAKKNMADAYREMGMLQIAEDIYQAIITENLTLSTEVSLQLISVYIENGKLDSAVQRIKQTVALNPDYPDVTELARTFFEDQHDWLDAIELALNEGIRTESVEWFDCLKTYVNKGLTKVLPPDYFSAAIKILYQLDKSRFEDMVLSIWNSYKQEATYFAWLEKINQLLLELDLNRNDSWHELARCYKETYFALIDGTYLINQLQKLVPNLLINWLKITDPAQAVFASTAALSWSELFPSSIPSASISDAEMLFSNTAKNVNEFDECLHLFDLIIEWAQIHDMGPNLRLKWMSEQLKHFELYYVFIAGVNGTDKSSFVNFVLGEDILSDTPTSSIVVFKENADLRMTEVTDSEVVNLPSMEEFQTRLERRRNALDSLLEFKQPAPFLLENKLSLIDTPELCGNPYDRSEILNYLAIADTVLFVLDSSTLFTVKERELLSYIQNEAPEIPIHFLLNKKDTIRDDEKAIQTIDETRAMIHSYLPNAKVFSLPSYDDHDLQLKDLSEFINSIKNTREIEDKRLAKLLSFIRSTITMLLKKRIHVENQLIESVRWNEDIVMKLKGAQNQLSDLESQKINVITRSYRSIKELMQKKILESIPGQLRECSQLIKEDSDFSKIHIELNKEMNSRLQDYIENTILPQYFHLLEDWITESKEEFEQGQAFLNEMADGFNSLYGEERMKLDCDLKILEDWRRDKDRMTSSIKLEDVNILLRRTPAQFLLKSAGKLFGAISQNNTMLCNKYKTFIETEDYSEPALFVSKQFFQQFELFEKSIERDIILLFKSPTIILNQFVEEAASEIHTNQEILKQMNTNPELFRDPLTLFEVRLRQYEWMTVSGKNAHVTYK